MVDAGSTDGTQEYASQCQQGDARIQLLFADKKSMGYQYNLGIAAAQGEYVGFCESDDYVDARMFAALYAAAAKQAFPDCVKSDYYMFFRRGEEEIALYCSCRPTEEMDSYRKVIRVEENVEGVFACNGNLWNGIYRRACINQRGVHFSETPGAAFQDHSFMLQTDVWCERWLFIPEAYYHYRRDNPGSSVNRKDGLLFVLQQIQFKIQYLAQHPTRKLLYGASIFAAQIGWLFSSYGGERKDRYTAEKACLEENLRREAIAFYTGMGYAQRSGIVKDQLVQFFLYAPQLFHTMAIAHYENEQANLYASWQFLCAHPGVVIFGSGERGQCLCMALLRNVYEGTICFCDNKAVLQGNVVMGQTVYSVLKAVQRYKDAVFVITNARYFYDMREQLLTYGVTVEQILLLDWVGPYFATGMDWRFCTGR